MKMPINLSDKGVKIYRLYFTANKRYIPSRCAPVDVPVDIVCSGAEERVQRYESWECERTCESMYM